MPTWRRWNGCSIESPTEDNFWHVRKEISGHGIRTLAEREYADDVLELDIKPENLLLRNGTAVIIQGLEKTPQWNGQRGLIQDFDTEKRRYAVKIEGRDRTLALNMGCCMPEAFVDMWEPEVCDPKLSAWRRSSGDFSVCRCRSKSRTRMMMRKHTVTTAATTMISDGDRRD